MAHRDAFGTAVLDLIRERRAPFDPDDVVSEFAEVLKMYSLRVVEGDRYAGEWVTERFRAHGIAYRQAKRTKNQIYGDFLPGVNSGRVALLDHTRLRAQLEGLERRVARGGKDSIDHPPGGHDDLANSVAGALVAVLRPPQGIMIARAELGPGDPGYEPDPYGPDDGRRETYGGPSEAGPLERNRGGSFDDWARGG